MKKTDIIEHITKKAINDGVEIICASDEGRPHPPITQCDSFKTLMNYFSKAAYSIRNGCETPKLIVKHDKYFTLKIKADDRHKFNKFAVISMDDSLEAKLYLDIPALSKEIHVLATRDSNDRYSCAVLSYNGIKIYPEEGKGQ